MHLGLGTLVDGRFEVAAVAGTGGMGTVYRARDHIGGRWAALKVLHRQHPDDLLRFAREASLLAELTHPGIVRYLSNGRTTMDEPYLAMEWLEGQPLARRLAETAFTPAEAVAIVREIADALAAAHRRDIVHRDLKPSNVFLVDAGPQYVKLLDFGVARRVAGESGLTGSGRLVGTFRYMSPEQVRGDKTIDARSDVFALGALLYECLTGRKAFPGADAGSVLTRVLLEDPPDVRSHRPEVPKDLAHLVDRLLSKERRARPDDAAAVACLLDELGPITLTVERPSLTLTSTERRMRWVLVGRLGEADTTVQLRAAPMGPTGSAGALDIVETHGGTLQPSPGDHLVATFSGGGSPIDAGIRAARCALSLQTALRRAPLSIACGVGVGDDTTPASEVVARATAALKDARRGIVQLDTASARLLEEHFEVRFDGTHASLRREPDPLEAVRKLVFLGRETLCVGRETELQHPRDRFRRVRGGARRPRRAHHRRGGRREVAPPVRAAQAHRPKGAAGRGVPRPRGLGHDRVALRPHRRCHPPLGGHPRGRQCRSAAGTD